MTASRIFLCLCLAFIGGIFLSSIISVPRAILLSFLISGITLISLFWRYKKLVVAGFCILFLVLGIWRHQSAEIRSTKSEIRNFNDRNEVITLIGTVSEEPDVREKSQKLTIKIDDWTRVLLTADRYPEYQYGDKLKITGKLEAPPILEGFNYQQYLQKEGIYSVMSWPKIELIDSGFGNPLMELLYSFKNKFQETAQKFISPPKVGLLEALAFGDESNIPKELKDKFNLTGTRHIAAVSGMNITIIASLLLTFVLSLGLWRQQAFFISVFLLVLYILMIGAPASAVRAGIMAGVLMAGQYFGRLSSAGRLVVFAAFLMLLQNPFLLTLDVGFQLSFLAILGIIYLQSSFSEKLSCLPNPGFFPLRAALATTLAAQVFTLPILLYNFGAISLVSPLTNILIVPLLAPITILIFIFGLSGMIFGPLGFIFSLPVWFFLTYILQIIEFFSKLPYASLCIENIHWIFLAIFYFVLGLIIWRLQESRKLKFLRY